MLGRLTILTTNTVWSTKETMYRFMSNQIAKITRNCIKSCKPSKSGILKVECLSVAMISINFLSNKTVEGCVRTLQVSQADSIF